MNAHRLGRFLVLSAAALVALVGAGTARADEVIPVTQLPDGGAPTAAPVAVDEAITPLTPNPSSYRLFLSTPGNGTIGNISYSDEDVLSYKPSTGQWLKSFDGTNAGLPASADVDALAYHVANLTTYIYMSFTDPVNVPTLGTVDDSDVVVYAASFGGSSWQLFFDGSQHGLTTAAEDVDGFELRSDDEFMLSTTGNFTVPGHYGNTISGGDEDVIYFVNGGFHFSLDGSSIGLGGTNDVTSIAYEYGGEGERFYLVLLKAFNLDGAGIAAGDVMLRTEGSYGMDSNTRFWRPVTVPKIDAFDLRLEP